MRNKMSSFQQQYKKKTAGFGNVAKGRLIRAEIHKELRKEQRSVIFNENRNTSSTSANALNKEVRSARGVEDRMTRFQKWKAEREKSRRLEQTKKKPPFVVGVVHHKLYSPLTTVPHQHNKSVTSNVMCESAPKRITRATQRRLMNKKLSQKEDAKNLVKNTNVTKKEQKDEKKYESFAPKDYKFKGVAGLPHIPLFGRVVLQSMSPVRLSQLLSSSSKKVHKNIPMKTPPTKRNIPIFEQSAAPREPVFFSPYVVSSRGKSSARKEERLKRGFSFNRSPKNEIPTKNIVMKNLNISVDEEERTAQYFQFLLNKEIARLNELCNKWTEIKAESETTEDGQYEINQAVGQTNLLINKKFERFRKLVADCETGKGQMLVTCKDLQGFWDMMYMEVKNCDLRFEKLEKLRSRGWKVEESPIRKPAVRKKTTLRKKVVSAKPNSIRAFLAEKKKKIGEGVKNNNGNIEELESKQNQISNSKYEKSQSPNTRYKTRRCMSIASIENKFTPMKHKRLSLLQQLEQSETSKKVKSPLTILKISRIYKSSENQLDDSVSYINSHPTPGKSILKQTNSIVQVESHIKTANKVNFDDDIILNNPVDEKNQIKMELAVSLSRIDSSDFNIPADVTIKAERKLTFDDNSYEDFEDDIKPHSEVKHSTGKNVAKVPSVQIILATPINPSNKNHNTRSQKRSIRRQNAIDAGDEMLNKTPPSNINTSASLKKITDDTDLDILKDKLQEHVFISDKEERSEHDASIKVLRNRIVTSTDTPKVKRSSRKVSISIEQSEQKENEIPSERRRRKVSLKVNTNSNEKMDLSNCIDNTYLEESREKRRSTRSVKFSEKDCTGCNTSKPTMPVTPHIRRSRTQSSEKKRMSTVTKDHIEWDSSGKPPERIRKSQNIKQ